MKTEIKNLPLVIKDKRDGNQYQLSLFIHSDGMTYMGWYEAIISYKCITKDRAGYPFDGHGTISVGGKTAEEAIGKMKGYLEEDNNWGKVEYDNN